MKSLMFLMVTVVALSGCTTKQIPVPEPIVEIRVIDTACTWVKPLNFSREDTPETKRQIIEHAKALQSNCPS